jgi:hypothetical protein
VIITVDVLRRCAGTTDSMSNIDTRTSHWRGMKQGGERGGSGGERSSYVEGRLQNVAVLMEEVELMEALASHFSRHRGQDRSIPPTSRPHERISSPI